MVWKTLKGPGASDPGEGNIPFPKVQAKVHSCASSSSSFSNPWRSLPWLKASPKKVKVF
jgi:hypothetical protein